MKRRLILFVISLLTTIATFSQTGYPKNIGDSLVIITADQLKKVNLTFLENSYLTDQNKLLSEKINLKDSLIFNYHQMDSINKANLIKLNNEVNFQKSKIAKLEKRDKHHKIIFWAGGSVLIATIIAFLVK